jgi:hypothetical protein
MTDAEKEAEDKMLQQHQDTAERVEKQNLETYGLRPSREEWDRSKMRSNDYTGRAGPKFNQD